MDRSIHTLFPTALAKAFAACRPSSLLKKKNTKAYDVKGKKPTSKDEGWSARVKVRNEIFRKDRGARREEDICTRGPTLKFQPRPDRVATLKSR